MFQENFFHGLGGGGDEPVQDALVAPGLCQTGWGQPVIHYCSNNTRLATMAASSPESGNSHDRHSTAP